MVGKGCEPLLNLPILNAGMMATPAALTTGGYESQFGTNCMGLFLLSNLLLPTLVRRAQITGADVQVISLSSRAHTFASRKGSNLMRSAHLGQRYLATARVSLRISSLPRSYAGGSMTSKSNISFEYDGSAIYSTNLE